ncbi:MAG: hypothetical protein AAFX06_01095 [Planctomycetota bacterium]
MDARFRVGRWMAVALMVLLGVNSSARAGNARSQNFLVHAPDQRLAEAVAEHAERLRDDLAEYWLGRRLPPWRTPCPIEVVAGPQLAAEGVTTYTRRPVGNFQMRVKGTAERILDSVLPHEVTHTVLATHFGRPLPRWADEGICTTVEHTAEKQKHEAMLRRFLNTRKGIPMNRLFLLTEYPQEMLPMYAQGYSVCRFLIEQSGPREFISFLGDYMQHPSWTQNVKKHYGYTSLAQLQEQWLAWVKSGSGPVDSFVSTNVRSRNVAPATTVAMRDASKNRNRSGSDSWYGRQLQDSSTPAAENIAAGPATRSLDPPSVISSGYYSVSQPRPEESLGERSQMSNNGQVPVYR